jgi:hypothetical protein
LSVLVSALPIESATVRKLAEDPGWSVEAYLLADLYLAFTGEEHPARPRPKSTGKSQHAEKVAALKAQRARVDAERNSA